jgi:hypothetical protein
MRDHRFDPADDHECGDRRIDEPNGKDLDDR